MPRRIHAFTLIELLVVITIIVVLLALLVPAMDKALYQAELMACGAGMDSSTTGLLNYAQANKRSYPDRGASGNHPSVFGNSLDQRVFLKDYISVNGLFNDPLSETVDYTDPNAVYGYAARSLWYSYQFAGEAAMRKVGQKWTWTDTFSSAARKYRFDVLISDIDFTAENSQVWGSHPDKLGVMRQEAFHAEAPPEHQLVAGTGVNKFAMSRWWATGTHMRGEVDLNFARTDGSIERMTDVRWEWMIRSGAEPTRLRGVPWNADQQFAEGTRCTVPIVN